MITSSLLFTFLGSFFLYNTSKKVELSHNLTIEKWTQSNLLASKFIGLMLYIISLTGAIFSFGKASGILFWMMSLMSALALLIIISPLKKGLFKLVSILFLVLFISELFF